VIAGISTDVCLTFAALSAVDLGYKVTAVIDASGTWSVIARDLAIKRLAMNNINLMGWSAVVGEL